MKRVLILLLLSSAFTAAHAFQAARPATTPAYRIEMNIKTLKDTTAYLGYYYGESTYLIDTARFNNAGKVVFDGKRPLSQGVYFLVLNKTRVFEFLIGRDQEFILTADPSDYVSTMVVNGDEDNQLFFRNMIYNMERNKEAEPYLAVVLDSLATEQKKAPAREALNAINRKVMAHQDELIAKNTGLLSIRIMKANRQIDIPEPPKRADGSIDSAFQLRYYRAHYWDNFDLSDDALIRLPRPVYMEKIKDYFGRLVVPSPDSVIREIDRLALFARKNQETFKYFIWMCVIEYQNPKVMGLDGVFVHLVRKYFDSGIMDFWINDKMKKTLKDRADQVGLSLMGSTAANLIMLDKDKKMHDLHKVVQGKKYTILFIFDPDCGHCRAETPKLVEFYNANKARYDLEVFAVSADSSMQKLREFVKEFKTPWITVNASYSYTGSYHKQYDADTTPSIYIIDRNKKIIAKKPPVEEFKNFFENQERLARMNQGGTKPPGK